MSPLREGFLTTVNAGKDVTLGYWNIRGLARPIRACAHVSGGDISEERYTIGKTAEGKYDYPEWFAYKKTERFSNFKFNPNLPYLEDKSTTPPTCLIESDAILKYVCRKYATESCNLYTGTSTELGLIDMFLAKFMEIRGKITGPAYMSKDITEFTAAMTGVVKKYEELITDLSAANAVHKKAFLFTDNISVADIVFHDCYEQMKVSATTCGIEMPTNPVVEDIYKKVSSHPKFAEYIASDRCIQHQQNNLSALFEGDFRNKK